MRSRASACIWPLIKPVVAAKKEPMDMVTIVWSMVASACLTLGLVHGLVWWQHREKLDRLWFALLAVSTAWFAYFEWSSLRAMGPQSYLEGIRWMQVPTWCMFVCMVGYVLTHLREGNRGLAGLAVGLRTLSVVLAFTLDTGVHFREITGLQRVMFLGTEVTLPVGSPSLLMLVPHGALVAMLVFVVGAAITVWRRGEHRLAVLVGGSVGFFVTLGALQSILGFWQVIKIPPGGSLYFLALLFVTAFELSMETKRVKALSVELAETRAKSREQVAHFGRVASLGGISVTLAHEINQPLGIILSNAQAAERMLAKDPPDLPEVRAILADIVRENLRASAVIQRTRELLQRKEVSRELVNLSDLAGEVFAIMRRPLQARQVTLAAELAAGLPLVSVDRIQLQQVLLNLMLNACEAMAANPPSERRLSVATRVEGGAVCLAVTDSGPGLPSDVEKILRPTSPPNRRAWAWACRSAGRLSLRTRANSWPSRPHRAGPYFG